MGEEVNEGDLGAYKYIYYIHIYVRTKCSAKGARAFVAGAAHGHVAVGAAKEHVNLFHLRVSVSVRECECRNGCIVEGGGEGLVCEIYVYIYMYIHTRTHARTCITRPNSRHWHRLCKRVWDKLLTKVSGGGGFKVAGRCTTPFVKRALVVSAVAVHAGAGMGIGSVCVCVLTGSQYKGKCSSATIPSRGTH